MMKMSKPRKPTKNNPATYHSKVSDLRRLMKYCSIDVDAETWLFLSIPELSPQEREIWLLDQKINFRGFKVDRELVRSVLEMVDTETKNLNIETYRITAGQVESATQRDRVLKYLKSAHGVNLPDLQAKTVEDALKIEPPIKGGRLLEIRQAISKTSTAKYQAFESRSRSDGRIRDTLLYHGASTGRWSGMGIQPHNFPRKGLPYPSQAAEILKEKDLELVRLIYGDPMNAFSACLRSAIIASEGKELFCADFAAIEARVLFWMAKHKAGIKAFNDDLPMYEEMAAVIYNINYIENVTKEQRQVGKKALLGCGYGMGFAKFLETCEQEGIIITEDVAKVAVNAYRRLHSPVTILWSNLERAAISAVQNPGKKFTINYCSWWTEKDFLWCQLPSGRKLAYYKPEIRFVLTPWKEKRPKLYHWEVNSKTRKWELAGTYGGKLTENVVSGTARDLMALSMLRIEKVGYEMLLSVHDEDLAEREIGKGSVEEFNRLMAELPPWAKGLPMKVEGWKDMRYHK